MSLSFVSGLIMPDDAGEIDVATVKSLDVDIEPKGWGVVTVGDVAVDIVDD